jgi:hypothetical protein
MRGLSLAVTALILVVASVVIALIVVGFAFNLFGSFASAGAVSPVGPSYIYTKNGSVYLNVTIDNRGPSVNITSATINGVPVNPSKITVYTASGSPLGTVIPAGQNQLVIVFTGVNPSIIGSGPANIQLILANGQTVYIAASVVAP